MKQTFALILIISLSFSSYAQYEDSNIPLYQSKVENYTKLKRTGNILTGAGALMTFGGIILVSTADWNLNEDNYGNVYYDSFDSIGLIGLTGIVIGIPTTAVGIVLSSIGARKVKYYNEKLGNIDLGYFQHGSQKGLTLVYTF